MPACLDLSGCPSRTHRGLEAVPQSVVWQKDGDKGSGAEEKVLRRRMNEGMRVVDMACKRRKGRKGRLAVGVGWMCGWEQHMSFPG